MDTLEGFLMKKTIDNGLLKIILSLSHSCSLIDKELSRYETPKIDQDTHINPTGDIQKPIDIECDRIIRQNISTCENVFGIISEEQEDIQLLSRRYNSNAFYSVAYDPLDGSDNTECNWGTGTIFGIYSENKDFLPENRKIICAGYSIYSSSTILVLTFGEDVYQFKLNRQTKFFKRMKENLVIPHVPKKILSCNPGNLYKWNKKDIDFYKWAISEKEKYTLRYSGCMVFDIHRILCQGGIFVYPSSKLRLLYECIPMSFIIEAANGISINGTKRILDTKITDIHQKSPIFIGCKRDVLIYKNFDTVSGIRNTFVIESFDSSGEEEISIKEGEKINQYNLLNDERWTRISVRNGESGIVPTKCLYFGNN